MSPTFDVVLLGFEWAPDVKCGLERKCRSEKRS